MVVVAVAALGFWGEQLRRRREYCLEMAARHLDHIFLPAFRLTESRSPNRFNLAPISFDEEESRTTDPHAAGFHWRQARLTTEDLEKLRKTAPHAAWHLNLRDAYLGGASRPWEAAPAEPMEPSHFPAPPGPGRAP